MQESDTSADGIRPPKSVKDLRSMFEQNISKPTVVNKKLLEENKQQVLNARKSKLLTNVFEQNIQKQQTLQEEKNQRKSVKEEVAPAQQRKTIKKLAVNPFEENIRKMKEQEELLKQKAHQHRRSDLPRDSVVARPTEQAIEIAQVLDQNLKPDHKRANTEKMVPVQVLDSQDQSSQEITASGVQVVQPLKLEDNVFIKLDRERQLKAKEEQVHDPTYKPSPVGLRPTIFKHRRTQSAAMPQDQQESNLSLAEVEHKVMEQVQKEQVQEYQNFFAQLQSSAAQKEAESTSSNASNDQEQQAEKSLSLSLEMEERKEVVVSDGGIGSAQTDSKILGNDSSMVSSSHDEVILSAEQKSKKLFSTATQGCSTDVKVVDKPLGSDNDVKSFRDSMASLPDTNQAVEETDPINMENLVEGMVIEEVKIDVDVPKAPRQHNYMSEIVEETEKSQSTSTRTSELHTPQFDLVNTANTRGFVTQPEIEEVDQEDETLNERDMIAYQQQAQTTLQAKSMLGNDSSSELFTDSQKEQKISVIELDSQMISVLEPSGNINQNSNTSEVEAIVVANVESEISGTPRIEIAGGTPDWQGNTQSYIQELSSAQPKDHEDVSMREVSQSEEATPDHSDVLKEQMSQLEDLNRGINSSQFVVEETSSSNATSNLEPGSTSNEELKSKVKLAPPSQVNAFQSDDEDLPCEEDYDLIDDDDESTMATQISETQRQIIANKTPLQVSSKELNNAQFRQAYLKEQVSAKQLIERKVEKKQILKQHAEEVKHNPKKNLVFKFVKSGFIS